MKTALENKGGDQLKQRREALRKRVPSKLDEFGPQLLQMAEEMKTIPDMLDWLKERGVTTSASNLSHFLKRQRGEAERNELKERLNNEKNILDAVEEWCEENANPKLETLIEIFKMLVLKLATKQELDPQLLKLADRLARTAIGYVNDQSRAEYRTRKLVMEEEKHAEWVKCEQQRALELSLDEAKKYPAVADMFRGAFAALEAAMEEEKRPKKAPKSNIQAPEKHQAPRSLRTATMAKDSKIEDEDEDEDESNRRVEANQTEAKRNKRACGRSREGKAPKTNIQASASASLQRDRPEKLQTPSSNTETSGTRMKAGENTGVQNGNAWAAEVGDGPCGRPPEDEEDREDSNPVELSETELENAKWRAEHGF
jgi:hypothetical protein